MSWKKVLAKRLLETAKANGYNQQQNRVTLSRYQIGHRFLIYCNDVLEEAKCRRN